MADQPRAVTRPWRRFAGLSVRALLILVFVLALGLGWIANRARIQREAVAAIERAGGKAWYNWEWQDDAPVPDARPRWPSWLVEAIGVDSFSDVVSVNLP